MEQAELRELLERVAAGDMETGAALLKLKKAPFEDLGFAKPDYHRSLRQGLAEVIYGAGKTPEQIRDIAARMRSQGQRTVLITRMRPEAAEVLAAAELCPRSVLLKRGKLFADGPSRELLYDVEKMDAADVEAIGTGGS